MPQALETRHAEQHGSFRRPFAAAESRVSWSRVWPHSQAPFRQSFRAERNLTPVRRRRSLVVVATVRALEPLVRS